MLFIVMRNDRLHEIIEEAIYNVVNEDHLKVVDNIDTVIAWVEENWTGPDDMWWIKIDQRKKDFRNFNKRNRTTRRNEKWWTRTPGPDGTSRENHVGYVIVRGRTKEDCVNSIRNAVVHLNPWAAKQAGVNMVRSNGNAEAIRIVCNTFFARSYMTINQRSIGQTVNRARADKRNGLFGSRAFHHRAGQSRTGVDSSGINWTLTRKYGLIDCDIDNVKAQQELEDYFERNNVKVYKKMQSHDGMHYILAIDDAKDLVFNFMDKYDTNNKAGDPSVLFKPDANMIVYSPIG